MNMSMTLSQVLMRSIQISVASLLLVGVASANECVTDITTGYNVKECDTTDYAIEADYCYLWCAPGWNGEYPTATCDPNTGKFILSGCEECTSTLQGCCSSMGQTCNMCQQGYFLDGGSCTPCPANCANCWGGEYCHLCESGYGPKSRISQGVDICQPCATGCLECLDSNTCLVCDEDNGYREGPNSVCEPFPCAVGSGGLCQTCLPESQRTANNQCTACNDGYVLSSWGSHECRACDDLFVNKWQCDNSCPGFIWDPTLGRIGHCKRESCAVPSNIAGASATGVCGASVDVINNGASCAVACASGYYAARATVDCDVGFMPTPLCLADSCSSCHGNAGCANQGASDCFMEGTFVGGQWVSISLCQQHAHFGLEWCESICTAGTSWDVVSKTCDACPIDAKCKTQGGNYCCQECEDSYGLNMMTHVCEACPLSTPAQHCQVPGGNYCCKECQFGYTLNVNTFRCEASTGNTNKLVTVELKLVALDYTKVMAQPNLREDLVNSIKDAILNTLPDTYTRNDINVELSQGSVIARAEVVPKSGDWTTALQSRVFGEQDSILMQVLSMAKELAQKHQLDILENGKDVADIMATMWDPTANASSDMSSTSTKQSGIDGTPSTTSRGTTTEATTEAPVQTPSKAPTVAPTGTPSDAAPGTTSQSSTHTTTLPPTSIASHVKPAFLLLILTAVTCTTSQC